MPANSTPTGCDVCFQFLVAERARHETQVERLRGALQAVVDRGPDLDLWRDRKAVQQVLDALYGDEEETS